MRQRDDADVEGFLEWVAHTKGQNVADVCRENFKRYPDDSPMEILVRARSKIYQEDLKGSAALADSPQLSDIDFT